MMQEARQFQFMVRPPADLYILSASVMDFLVPNRLHALFRPASFTWIGNQIAPVSERTISIGYVALGLALAAVLLARRKALFLVGGGDLLFAAGAGPAVAGRQHHLGRYTAPPCRRGRRSPSWTPYALLNRLVPFMRISRSVSRFALLVQLSMAVLAALGCWLAGLLRGCAGQRAGPAGPMRSWGLVVLGIGFEYWVAPYPLSPPDTPDYYATLAVDPDPRAVLNLPMNYDRPGYLLYQTVHGKPLTVAYISRDDPRTLTERVPVLQHLRHLGPDIIDGDPALVGPTVLADLGVGTVILDRYKMPGGKEREYTEELAGRIFAGQDAALCRRAADRLPRPAAAELESLISNWGRSTGGRCQEGEDGAGWRAMLLDGGRRP